MTETTTQWDELRILVVEDNDSFADFLTSFLARLPGVRVIGSSASGREAVSLALRLGPHLALIDFHLEGVSGFETATRIRRHLPSTQVVLTSSHDAPEYRAAALKAGAHGFMAKGDVLTALPGVIQLCRLSLRKC